MDKVDNWWDFDSGMVFVGISEEWSDEQTEESSGGLPKARYVPIVNSDADMDHGLIIALTMVVLCVILILLAAVGLVVYSKIVRQRRRPTAAEKASGESQPKATKSTNC